MSLYAADGSTNVTVVDGSAWTGLYAADGSYNVVQADGTSYVGLMNNCGAYNVFLSTSEDDPLVLGYIHPCGAINVSTDTYIPETFKVTVVDGEFDTGE